MVVQKKPCQLFLSHAAADKQLVEAFETLLARSMGLTSADIFCSSLEGQGVTKGGSFVDEIRAKAAASDGVVALISPAYLDSAFCMAELGAAWVLKTQRLPIVVPPNTFKVMDATLLGIVGVKIDDDDAMAQAFEDFASSMGIALPAVAVRQRAMREFLRTWNSLKNDITPSDRIEASVHDAVVSERDTAVTARDAAEQELSQAEAQIAALRQSKDAVAVAEIDKEFDNSNWHDQLEEALDQIRGSHPEVGGKEIVRLIILDQLGKFTRPDHNNYPEETSRAIELDVYDEENFRWDYSNPDVSEIVKNVDIVKDIFSEYPDAAKQYKTQKMPNDPNRIKFWEEVL